MPVGDNVGDIVFHCIGKATIVEASESESICYIGLCGPKRPLDGRAVHFHARFIPETTCREVLHVLYPRDNSHRGFACTLSQRQRA